MAYIQIQKLWNVYSVARLRLLVTRPNNGSAGEDQRGRRYEYVECDLKVHPKYGTKVCDCTQDMIRSIEGKTYPSINRIKISTETSFFTNDGQPLLWYYEYSDGKLEFFNQPGIHPQYNVNLIPVSKEIVTKVLGYIKSNNSEMILSNSNEIPEKINSSRVSTSNPVKVIPTLISEYLISSRNSNQMNNLTDEIQTLIEKSGHSVTISNNGNSSPIGLRGKYRTLIVLSGKLNSTPSSIDESSISTAYVYSIKIYDVENSKLLNSKSDRIVSVGFSESENVGNIEKQILDEIKNLL